MRLALFAGAVVLGLTVNAHAASLEPLKASDLVALQASAVPDPICGSNGRPANIRVTSDGQFEVFEVPLGKVLVIMGVHWQAFGNASEVATMNLGTNGGSVFFGGGSLAGTNGVSAGTALIPHHAVRPGLTLCLSSSAPSFNAGLHGFLAKDH